MRKDSWEHSFFTSYSNTDYVRAFVCFKTINITLFSDTLLVLHGAHKMPGVPIDSAEVLDHSPVRIWNNKFIL